MIVLRDGSQTAQAAAAGALQRMAQSSQDHDAIRECVQALQASYAWAPGQLDITLLVHSRTWRRIARTEMRSARLSKLSSASCAMINDSEQKSQNKDATS